MMDDGAQRRELIFKRLAHLTPRLREAFAVMCAERALAVFALDNPSKDDSLSRAVDLMWERFASDASVDARLASAADAVERARPNVELEPHRAAANFAAIAVESALDCFREPTSRHAYEAAIYNYDAHRLSAGDIAAAGELQWQERALNWLEGWGEKPITRAMFAALVKSGA